MPYQICISYLLLWNNITTKFADQRNTHLLSYYLIVSSGQESEYGFSLVLCEVAIKMFTEAQLEKVHFLTHVVLYKDSDRYFYSPHSLWFFGLASQGSSHLWLRSSPLTFRFDLLDRVLYSCVLRMQFFPPATFP